MIRYLANCGGRKTGDVAGGGGERLLRDFPGGMGYEHFVRERRVDYSHPSPPSSPPDLQIPAVDSARKLKERRCNSGKQHVHGSMNARVSPPKDLILSQTMAFRDSAKKNPRPTRRPVLRLRFVLALLNPFLRFFFSFS